MKPYSPRVLYAILARSTSTPALRAWAPKATYPQALKHYLPRRYLSATPRRPARPQPADDPNFTSIVDNPPKLVRVGKRYGYGLVILAIIPITAFALGTWQVQRLGWKTRLLAKLEDRIVRPPLPLPPDIDPEMVQDFDYRRVYATGKLRHDQEMLVGPRINDGSDGYFVVTPLERNNVVGPDGKPTGKKGSTVLVNRGWVAKKFKDQRSRIASLETGEITVEGLLREPWKKNRFTPENRPDLGEFYFPDVKEMARLTGAAPIWIEETTEPDMLEFMEKKEKGIPIARAAVVDVRNNHAQYIFTWYGLCLATSIMFYLVVKKPPGDTARRVRMNKGW